MILRHFYLLLLIKLFKLNELIASQISSIETYTFLTRCNNKSINYDSKSPIEIANYEYQWTSPKIELKECALNIIKNSTDVNLNDESSFIIKFKFNLSNCQGLEKPRVAISLLDFTQNNKSIVESIDLCDKLQANPFLLINSTKSFQIKLVENQPFNYPFSSIDSIIITSFNYAQNNVCKENEFKCGTPSNICIDSKFKCGFYDSCVDNTDHLNCDFSATTKTTEQTTASMTTNLSNTTGILIVDNNSEPKKGSKLGFFIGLLITIGLITSALIGIWYYGRRNRRTREFLAQLQNNTDWEYEQLDDEQSLGTSRVTMSPIFDMNTINDESESNSNRRKNERTPISPAIY